jgi:hypothetical protein
VNDFTLRLAAYYDASRMDYPVAASAPVHIVLEAPTPMPTETPTDTPTPELTPSVTPTETPGETSTPEATPGVTETPGSPTPEPSAVPTSAPVQAVIISPVSGAQLNGPIDVLGTAEGPAFAGYQMDFGPGDTPAEGQWQPVGMASTTPVNNGLLVTWNTKGLTPGTYTLRLHVFDTTGAYVESRVVVNLVAP